MRFQSWSMVVLFVLFVLFVTACPTLPRERELSPGAFHGNIVGVDGPIGDALVRVLGRPGGVVSSGDGRFVLPVNVATSMTIVVTAGPIEQALASVLEFDMGLIGITPEAVDLGNVAVEPAGTIRVTGITAGDLVVAIRENPSRPTEVMGNEVATADNLTFRYLPAGRYLVMSTSIAGTVAVAASADVGAGAVVDMAVAAVADLTVVQPTDVRASALRSGDITATLLLDRALAVGVVNPPIQNDIAAELTDELSFVWPNLPAGVWNAALTFNDGRAGAATIAVVPGIAQTSGQLVVSTYPLCACVEANLVSSGCDQPPTCATYRARMLLSAPGLATADDATIPGTVRNGSCVITMVCSP